MVNKLFTLLFLLISFHLFSQGNLQFNQAILTEFSCTNPANYINGPCNPASFSVPVGKVWKIEQASLFVDLLSGFSVNNPSQGYSLFINNTLIFSSNGNLVFTPLWLPAGSYTIKVANICNTNCYPYRGSINAIEFNIIP
jgi:hypothetical protein